MIEKVTRKKDTYRPAFCTTQFYVDYQTEFNRIQKRITPLHQIEQITLWIICCACLRRPKTWYAGLKEKINVESNSSSLIYEIFSEINIAWPKQLPQNMSTYDFCRSVNIAALPKAALNSLLHFFTEHYPLEILCYEPDPFELLKIQMTGKRILTFESDFKKWPTLKYGERDVLSFWIHDLIHAEHFFSHPQNLRGQIGFYRLVYEILNHKLLDTLLLSTDFNKEFSYLISDMNSHPVHLIKTLQAHLQRRDKSLWERVILMPIFSSYSETGNPQQILQRVNTCYFTTEDAIKLTAFCELDLYQLTLS